MGGRNAVMIVVIIAALAVAGIVLANHLSKKDSGGEQLDRAVHMTCLDCKHDFQTTVAEYVGLKGDSGEGIINCPNCDSPGTKRGEPCYECDRVILTTGHNRMPENCPHCKAALSPTTGTP